MALSRHTYRQLLNGHTCYDVMPDGRMFLMVTRAAGTGRATTHLNVVLDWFRSVKR